MKKKALPDPHTFIIQSLRQLSRGAFSIDQVFSDFVEMAAIAYSNQLADLLHYDEREVRYMQIIKGYEKLEDRILFPQMTAELFMAYKRGLHDALGKVFMELELGNKHTGQYFTPYEISYMMAKVTMTDFRKVIDQNGFVTVCDPTCGAGGMLIAVANVLEDEGIDYRKYLHATGVDIALRCVHMTYIQLSLLDIPALIQFGNVLSLEPKQTWVTPAHVRDGWTQRLLAQHDKNVQEDWDKKSMPARIAAVERLGLNLSAALAKEPPVAAQQAN